VGWKHGCCALLTAELRGASKAAAEGGSAWRWWRGSPPVPVVPSAGGSSQAGTQQGQAWVADRLVCPAEWLAAGGNVTLREPQAGMQVDACCAENLGTGDKVTPSAVGPPSLAECWRVSSTVWCLVEVLLGSLLPMASEQERQAREQAGAPLSACCPPVLRGSGCCGAANTGLVTAGGAPRCKITPAGSCQAFMESLRLEKTPKIVKSNRQPNTTVPA